MQFFYPHLPWVIDNTEYNCSIRPLSEWQSRGSVNFYQGIYFTTAGTIFAGLYVLALTGMYRLRLLKNPCYKLMFLNGFIDLSELFETSYVTSYFHFTGAVFCSSVAMGWAAGHLGFCLWCGSTFSCIVLGLNRIVEMTEVGHRFCFIFRGKLIYIWISISLLLIVGSAFLIRPIPFNTVVSAYISDPMIVDDPEIKKDFGYNTSLLITAHGFVEGRVMGGLYGVLCYLVWKKWNAVYGSEKLQRQLLIQVTLICLPTMLTGLLYGIVELFPGVPRYVLITTNVVWQLSHGLHGIVYLCFNTRIREEVINLIVRNGKVTIPCSISHIINRNQNRIRTLI